MQSRTEGLIRKLQQERSLTAGEYEALIAERDPEGAALLAPLAVTAA